MITCKEDLFDTYIKNDFGKLRDLYVSACNEFGIEKFIDCKLDLDVIAVFSCNSGVSDPWELIDINREDEISEMTELTLKDLAKPTPTKFVKVEESIFDLKEEFERGELYFSVCSEGEVFEKIERERRLMNNLASGNVYRQVEIDWRDEVKEIYDAVELPVGVRGKLYMGKSWDEQEFIKFCHLVASLTEKPEGV
ncbi:hypothetical protein MYOV024v1_p0040 [Vibrio phage PS34B.2]|nr:hypothetical protein MYOV024v1_p0040 [Vibrio phage PS34B.2]